MIDVFSDIWTKKKLRMQQIVSGIRIMFEKERKEAMLLVGRIEPRTTAPATTWVKEGEKLLG